MKSYDYAVRVSDMGDRDELQSVTIPDQHKRCKEYITGVLGGRVGKWFDCVDVSGGVVIDSPGYQEALARVVSGKSAGFVLAYSSRFARNAWAVGRYLEQLKQVDGELWFVDRPGIDYRTPSGAIIVSVDAVMNDNYLVECKTRAETTIAENIVRRGIPSKCPYGYLRNATYNGRDVACMIDPALDPKALVPDEGQAATVRRIFDRRGEGYSWIAIADELNRDGIPSPRGGEWTVPTLRGIVANESYLGVVQYKRRIGGRRAKKGLSGVVVRHEHAHEPLVTLRTWRNAQSAVSVQRNGHYTAGVAGGLVRCCTCRSGMVVTGSRHYLTYGCRSRHSTGRCSQPMHVTRDAVDALVDAEVAAKLHGAIGTSQETDLVRLLAAELEAREELEAYVEIASATDRRAFEKGLRTRQQKLDAAVIAREEAEARASLTQELPAPDAYLDLPVDGRRRVARALIERVVVHPVCSRNPVDRIEILWH